MTNTTDSVMAKPTADELKNHNCEGGIKIVMRDDELNLKLITYALLLKGLHDEGLGNGCCAKCFSLQLQKKCWCDTGFEVK